MAFTKLNHERLQKEMKRTGLRAIDLARLLCVSRQMMNYIIHKGGKKYAPYLARIFGRKTEDMIVPERLRTPKRLKVINNKVRTKKQ